MAHLSRNCFNLLFALASVLYAAQAAGAGTSPAPPLTPLYADVQPIFQSHCIVCHSSDNLQDPSIAGRLALDSYAAIRKGVVAGNKNTLVVIPGNSAKSELILRLHSSNPNLLMPKGGPPISQKEIALLAKWIDEGAHEGLSPKTIGTGSAFHFSSLPLPENRGILSVRLSTRIPLPKELDTSGSNKIANMDIQLKVGPLSPIYSLAFSPDGKMLAVGQFRAVVIWSLVLHRAIGSLLQLAGPAMSLAFSHDGSLLAVGSGYAGKFGQLRVYRTSNLLPVGAEIKPSRDTVLGIAWSAHDHRLGICSQDHTASIWSWPSEQNIYRFDDASDAVTGAAFSPDGRWFYTSSMDRNLRRYNTINGKPAGTFSGSEESVTAMAILPNGQEIVSSGRTDRLHWWNVNSDGLQDRRMSYYGRNGPTNSLAVSEDGRYVLAACADGKARLSNSNGDFVRDMECGSDWLYAAAISSDGKLAAVGGADGMVRIWQTDSGRLLLTFLEWPLHGGSDGVQWLAVTPEGYYDGSSGWIKLVQGGMDGKPIHSERIISFVHSLDQPESLQKAWQGNGLPAANIPESSSVSP